MRLAGHLILFRELFPFTLVCIIWLVHLVTAFLQIRFLGNGLLPRTLEGLIGILTAPLLHADFLHLIGNTLPLIVLGFLLFNAYRTISGQIFWFIYLLTNLMVWLFARSAYHIGASGIVYGLAAFLFFSGIIRRHIPLMVISLLVVFMYGYLIWGILPLEPGVSWESHLYGLLTGAMLSWVFRHKGPQRRVFWQDEEEDTDEPPTFDENGKIVSEEADSKIEINHSPDST
jgi:membrane associated rhomboid family serine protease